MGEAMRYIDRLSEIAVEWAKESQVLRKYGDEKTADLLANHANMMIGLVSAAKREAQHAWTAETV